MGRAPRRQARVNHAPISANRSYNNRSRAPDVFVTGRSDNSSTMPLTYASPAGPLVSGLGLCCRCNQAAGALVLEVCALCCMCAAADVTGLYQRAIDV